MALWHGLYAAMTAAVILEATKRARKQIVSGNNDNEGARAAFCQNSRHARHVARGTLHGGVTSAWSPYPTGGPHKDKHSTD